VERTLSKKLNSTVVVHKSKSKRGYVYRLTVKMETSMCVADPANWGNIELAGTNPTYRPLPHRCESHITSHSLSVARRAAVGHRRCRDVDVTVKFQIIIVASAVNNVKTGGRYIIIVCVGLCIFGFWFAATPPGPPRSANDGENSTYIATLVHYLCNASNSFLFR